MAIRSSCVPWRSTSGDRSYAWPVAGEDLTGRANGVPEEPGDYCLCAGGCGQQELQWYLLSVLRSVPLMNTIDTTTLQRATR
ncbi:hypothetical protein VPH35_040959 [Triticum aestivum]|uniref:Uncharacterized protein n=1 Tax=Aegilops tauschii subsp. strangulata TaxID=200361 RepID=A0A453DE65_AEGTS